MLATPEIAAGKHVLSAAETGSGKTLAYMSPIVSRLRMEEDQQGYKRLPQRPRALVLVPLNNSNLIELLSTRSTEQTRK